MKNWKTTLGGAVNGLGKTLRGIPAMMIAFDPSCVADPACIRKYAFFYIAGLVVSAIGGFFSDLFSQDSQSDQPSIPVPILMKNLPLLAIISLLAVASFASVARTNASEVVAAEPGTFLADVSLDPYGTVSWTGIKGKAVYGAGAEINFGLTKNLGLTYFAEADDLKQTFIERTGLGLRYTAWAGSKLSLDAGIQVCYDVASDVPFLRLPLGANFYLVKSPHADLSLRAAYAFDISGHGPNGTSAGRAFLGPVLNFKF